MKSSAPRRLGSLSFEPEVDEEEIAYENRGAVQRVAAAQASPFSVSLSYTIPKRSASSQVVMPSAGAKNAAGAPPASAPAAAATDPRHVLREMSRMSCAATASPPPREAEPTVSSITTPISGASASSASLGLSRPHAAVEDELLPELLQKLRRRVDLNVAPPQSAGSSAAGAAGRSRSVVTAVAAPVEQQQQDRLQAQAIPKQSEELQKGRSKNNNTLRQLPLEIVLHVLTYCNIQGICCFSQTSQRCNVMASSTQLWRAIARGLRIDGAATADGPTARRKVKEYVVAVRRELTETLHVEENRLQQVEERIRERVREAPPFSAQFIEESLSTQPRLSELLERTQTQVEALDMEARSVQALRLDLVHSIQANKEQIRNLQLCLDNMERTHGAKNSSQENYWLITRFEAKVCRLILGDLKQLPVVIRRGTTSFSVMELLTLQLARDELGTAVRTRWDGFKKICPLQEPYFQLVDSINSQDRKGAGGGMTTEVPRECQSVFALVKKLAEMSDGQLKNLIGL